MSSFDLDFERSVLAEIQFRNPWWLFIQCLLYVGGGGSEYPKMKMSGVAPVRRGRKKSQRTGVQPCMHPSWIENKLENEGRGETTDTYDKR